MKKKQRLTLKKDIIARIGQEGAQRIKGGLPYTLSCVGNCQSISCNELCPADFSIEFLSNLCLATQTCPH